MMYTRAAASDYDDWGATGWTADDLLPLLKKVSTYSELATGLGVSHLCAHTEHTDRRRKPIKKNPINPHMGTTAP